MRRFVFALAIALAFVGVSSTAASAEEYGNTAKVAAKHLGCGDYKIAEPGTFTEYGSCKYEDLGGRVYLITFVDKDQQNGWLVSAKRFIDDDFYVAYGRGVVAFSRLGSHRTAKYVLQHTSGTLKNLH